MITINRRGFLQSLIALGAAIALPAKATPAQVDKAWQEALAAPWYFGVSYSGTIVEANGEEPKVNSDVYDLYLGSTVKSLIDEVDRHSELRGHFRMLAADELDNTELSLRDDGVDAVKRARLIDLKAALQDEDYGWQHWVKLEGAAGLPRFHAEIDKWLGKPVNWGGTEFWPQGWSGQGKALAFFRQVGHDVRQELGVVIVEGEHPGSSYYAAQLRAPIEQANEVADLLGLPFRFRKEAA